MVVGQGIQILICGILFMPAPVVQWTEQDSSKV